MALTDKDVLAALSELIDPATGRNYVEGKSAKNVKIDGERVWVDIVLGYPARSAAWKSTRCGVSIAAGNEGSLDCSKLL